MDYLLHQFSFNHTINGALKLVNGHDLTPEQIEMLIEEFNRLNGAVPPKVGQTVKIPKLGT